MALYSQTYMAKEVTPFHNKPEIEWKIYFTDETKSDYFVGRE